MTWIYIFTNLFNVWFSEYTWLILFAFAFGMLQHLALAEIEEGKRRALQTPWKGLEEGPQGSLEHTS